MPLIRSWLALGSHGKACHNNLDLVGLERDIVAVEVAAVIDVVGGWVDNRVVACRVEFVLQHAA